VDLPRVELIIKRNPTTKAYLALLGDKHIQLNEAGTAFLMYGISGSSCIALCDPIGPSGSAPELIHRFAQAGMAKAARPVFHEVGPDNLAIYADLGLVSFHIADEARVPLASFTLDGSAMRALRNHVRAAGRRCSFELISHPVREHLLAEFRQVSDEWLATRKTREKRFSMGCFDPQYVRRFQIGAVRQNNAVVAFTTIWPGAGELFIDLMRFRSTAPRGSMDFLIVNLIQWAQSGGYKWLNLGMAPLPKPELPLSLHHPSSWMITIGRGLAERFYHFDSLREFKDKFRPQWRPRYFVSPSGYGTLRALADLAALTSGGWRGVISR